MSDICLSPEWEMRGVYVCRADAELASLTLRRHGFRTLVMPAPLPAWYHRRAYVVYAAPLADWFAKGEGI